MKLFCTHLQEWFKIFRERDTGTSKMSPTFGTSLNPSAWSDECWSSWRKHHLSWSDDHCSSCCTLSLIRLYLGNIGSKCNRAASCLFVKELALLWCGRQLLEIISSFFLCSRILCFLFAVPNFTDGFMPPSNSEMKHETNVITLVT